MDQSPITLGERRPTALVLGGGLAGISAACALGDAGFQVTLLERRGFLGGRAFSFPDAESGWDVDNGQHVFLGCCTAYVGLLRRLGVLDQTSLQDHLSIPIIEGGRTGHLWSAPLPPPLHLAPAFMRYPHLGLMDKLRLAYGMHKVRWTNRAKNREALQQENFLSWLRSHRQTQRIIDAFWNLITLPTLNSPAEHVTADMGLMVFQEGLLRDRHSADIGYARVGLTALVQDAALTAIGENGGEVRFQTPLLSIEMEGEVVVGVRTAEGLLQADAYVSALPFDTLLEMLPSQISATPFFQGATALRWAPIVGVHVWLDRWVTDLEVVAFLDSEIQWLFNKSLIQGRPKEESQYLCISLSGAWQYADVPNEELERRFVEELRRLFPEARLAEVTRVLVVKQRQATFIPDPASDAGRLPATTPVPNLFLAGDWTDTGWPATMESAVRSGNTAAKAAEGWLGSAEDVVPAQAKGTKGLLDRIEPPL